MTKTNRLLAERAYEANVRLGHILHIPFMMIDPEGIPEELADFIDDDLDDRVIAQLLPVCPDLDKVVKDAWAEYEEEKQHSGHRDASRYRRYNIADFIRRRLTVPYIVCIEFQIVRYHSRDERFPLGSLSSGWGYTKLDWVGAKSPEDAIRQGIRISLAHQKEAWAAAPERAKKPDAENAHIGTSGDEEE